MMPQEKHEDGSRPQSARARHEGFVLSDAVLATRTEATEDHHVEAVHHVLAEPRLQLNALRLHSFRRCHLRKLVLADW